MQKENLEFLKERLYFLGFPERLNKTLEEKMKAGEKEFKLGIDGKVESKGMEKKISYELDFAKSSKQDRYFLNSYTANLHRGDALEASQKIFLNNGWGLSSRESFNLLEGRSVYKTLKNKKDELYEAWVKIDFGKQDDYGNNKLQMYSDGWKYDLSRQLHKWPIKELQDSGQKDDLLYSLSKGNLALVNFVIDSHDVKRYIEANPAGRNILVYDDKYVLQNAPKEERKEQQARPDRSGGIFFNDSTGTGKDVSKDQTKDTDQGRDLVAEGAGNSKGKKNGRGV
jgi:hypothetical protein